jgi:hypothetical protein
MFFLFLLFFFPRASSIMLYNVSKWVHFFFTSLIGYPQSSFFLPPPPTRPLCISTDFDRRLQEVCGAGNPTERLDIEQSTQRGVITGPLRCNQLGDSPISFE